jgi:hypothetical protein
MLEDIHFYVSKYFFWSQLNKNSEFLMNFKNELHFIIITEKNMCFLTLHLTGSVTVHKPSLWTVHKALDHKHGNTAQLLAYTTFYLIHRTAQTKKGNRYSFSIFI